LIFLPIDTPPLRHGSAETYTKLRTFFYQKLRDFLRLNPKHNRFVNSVLSKRRIETLDRYFVDPLKLDEDGFGQNIPEAEKIFLQPRKDLMMKFGLQPQDTTESFKDYDEDYYEDEDEDEDEEDDRVSFFEEFKNEYKRFDKAEEDEYDFDFNRRLSEQSKAKKEREVQSNVKHLMSIIDNISESPHCFTEEKLYPITETFSKILDLKYSEKEALRKALIDSIKRQEGDFYTILDLHRGFIFNCEEIYNILSSEEEENSIACMQHLDSIITLNLDNNNIDPNKNNFEKQIIYSEPFPQTRDVRILVKPIEPSWLVLFRKATWPSFPMMCMGYQSIDKAEVIALDYNPDRVQLDLNCF
jgi:hypothetical protein